MMIVSGKVKNQLCILNHHNVNYFAFVMENMSFHFKLVLIRHIWLSLKATVLNCNVT